MAGTISTSWNVATDPLPALPPVSQIPADLTNTSSGSSTGGNSSVEDTVLNIILTFLGTAAFALGPVAGPLAGGTISALKSIIDSLQSSQTSMQPLLSSVVTDLGTITSQGQINKDAGVLQTYYTELSGQIAALDIGDIKAIPADIETDSGPLGQLFRNLRDAVSNPSDPLILAVGDLQNGGGLNSQLTYQAQAFSAFIGAAGYHIFLYYYYWRVLNQCKASERVFSTREFIIQIKNYAYYAINEVNAITTQITSRLNQISSVNSGNYLEQGLGTVVLLTGLSFDDTGTIIAYPVPPNNCNAYQLFNNQLISASTTVTVIEDRPGGSCCADSVPCTDLANANRAAYVQAVTEQQQQQYYYTNSTTIYKTIQKWCTVMSTLNKNLDSGDRIPL